MKKRKQSVEELTKALKKGRAEYRKLLEIKREINLKIDHLLEKVLLPVEQELSGRVCDIREVLEEPTSGEGG